MAVTDGRGAARPSQAPRAGAGRCAPRSRQGAAAPAPAARAAPRSLARSRRRRRLQAAGRSQRGLRSPGAVRCPRAGAQLQGAVTGRAPSGEGLSPHQHCKCHCSATWPLLELGQEDPVSSLGLGWKIKLWQQLLLKGTQNKIINYGHRETRNSSSVTHCIHLGQKGTGSSLGDRGNFTANPQGNPSQCCYQHPAGTPPLSCSECFLPGVCQINPKFSRPTRNENTEY